jgi:hypothetical protein
MHNVPMPLHGEAAESSVTQAEFNTVFESLSTLSFLEIAQSTYHPEAGVVDWYRSSIESVRSQIQTYPGETDDHKQNADRILQYELFGEPSKPSTQRTLIRGLDGPQQRMVVLGFKPATLVGRGYPVHEVSERFGAISLDYLSVDSLITHGVPNQNLGFVPREDEEYDGWLYHSGEVYNNQAVESVVAHNQELFRRLGYDTSVSGHEIARQVFQGPDAIAQSILRGYSPRSSVLFYIAVPGDLDGLDQESGEPIVGPRAEYFWNAATAILTKDQLDMARRLVNYDGPEGSLDAFGSTIANEDYFELRPTNRVAQEAFRVSGMDRYVEEYRDRLFAGTDRQSALIGGHIAAYELF